MIVREGERAGFSRQDPEPRASAHSGQRQPPAVKTSLTLPLIICLLEEPVMAKRPTQKQLEQIKARCDRIQDWKIERIPIGKLTVLPINFGKWATIGKKRPPD